MKLHSVLVETGFTRLDLTFTVVSKTKPDLLLFSEAIASPFTEYTQNQMPSNSLINHYKSRMASHSTLALTTLPECTDMYK